MSASSSSLAQLDPNGGAMRIARERLRQIEEEDWTPEHDAEHREAELAWAAICYAAPRQVYRMETGSRHVSFVDPWPWDRYARDHFNDTKARLRQLEKAGALIAAEIDRLLRAGAVA